MKLTKAEIETFFRLFDGHIKKSPMTIQSFLRDIEKQIPVFLNALEEKGQTIESLKSSIKALPGNTKCLLCIHGKKPIAEAPCNDCNTVCFTAEKDLWEFEGDWIKKIEASLAAARDEDLSDFPKQGLI